MIEGHTERDFMESIVKCLTSKVSGRGMFWEFRIYIEQNFALNEADLKPVPSLGCPKWHQIIRNLKSNKSLLKEFPTIKACKGGFELIDWNL